MDAASPVRSGGKLLLADRRTRVAVVPVLRCPIAAGVSLVRRLRAAGIRSYPARTPPAGGSAVMHPVARRLLWASAAPFLALAVEHWLVGHAAAALAVLLRLSSQ